jgi:hypothetical protein
MTVRRLPFASIYPEFRGAASELSKSAILSLASDGTHQSGQSLPSSGQAKVRPPHRPGFSSGLFSPLVTSHSPLLLPSLALSCEGPLFLKILKIFRLTPFFPPFLIFTQGEGEYLTYKQVRSMK